MLPWTACIGQGTPKPIVPYVNRVQRQVWQDVIRYDSLKGYTRLLEFHVDSLNLELNKGYELLALQDTRLAEKDHFILLMEEDKKLDQQKITILTTELKQKTRGGKLLKGGLILVSGFLIYKTVKP